MKPAVIVGLIIGVVIAAAFTLFATNPPASQETRRATDEAAELARRHLAEYSPVATLSADVVDTEALAQADLSELAAIAKTEVEQRKALIEEFGGDPKVIPDALPAGKLADPKSGAPAFAKAIKANDEAFKSALEALKTAGDGTVYASLMTGLAHMTASERHLLESDRLHQELDAHYAEAVVAATRYRITEISRNYYADLDIDPIIEDLESGDYGLEWARGENEDTRDKLEEVRSLVAERQAALDTAREALEAKHAERLTLEQQSFPAGDNAAFEAYRTRYAALTAELKALQTQVQTLENGGELDGETIVGAKDLARDLEAMERAAALYEDTVTRINESIVRIQDAKEFNENQRTDRSSDLEKYKQVIASELTTIVGRKAGEDGGESIVGLISQVYDEEMKAVSEAQAAQRAFKNAATQVAAHLRDVRSRRSEKDPQKKNELYEVILSDRYAEQIAQAAEADAYLLEGRLRWQILRSQARYMEFRDFVSRNAGVMYDPATTIEAMDTSRDEGVKKLEAAIAIYEKLANVPVNTTWIPRSSLSVAQFMLSRLDESRRDSLENDARLNIDQAVVGRSTSPYLTSQVRYRTFLYDVLGFVPGEVAPGETPEGEAPADTDSTETPTTPDEFDEGGGRL